MSSLSAEDLEALVDYFRLLDKIACRLQAEGMSLDKI